MPLATSLAIGAGVLVQLEPGAQLVALASVPFIGVYPLMKRVVHYPQIFLGVTMSLGVPCGWAAMRGGAVEIDAVAPLYIAGVAWTMVYDTIYAHQDKVDDVRAGIKSSALALGDDYTKPVLGVNALVFASALGTRDRSHTHHQGGREKCPLPGETSISVHL